MIICFVYEFNYEKKNEKVLECLLNLIYCINIGWEEGTYIVRQWNLYFLERISSGNQKNHCFYNVWSSSDGT